MRSLRHGDAWVCRWHVVTAALLMWMRGFLALQVLAWKPWCVAERKVAVCCIILATIEPMPGLQISLGLKEHVLLQGTVGGNHHSQCMQLDRLAHCSGAPQVATMPGARNNLCLLDEKRLSQACSTKWAVDTTEPRTQEYSMPAPTKQAEDLQRSA